MLKTILTSVFGTGGAAAAIWWTVNRMYQINGAGWLERQPFPLNSVWVFGGVGAVIGLVLGILRHKRNVLLQEGLAEVAEAGEVEEATDELPAMPLFENRSALEHRIARTVDGIRVECFDLTTATATDEGNRYTKRTVVLVPAEGLAHFNLNAKTAGFRFLAWMGAEGVTFDPAAGTTPKDQAAIEGFGRLFQLTTAPTTELVSGNTEPITDGEESARQAFSLGVLKWLSKRPGWSMQSHGGFLALWRGGDAPGARQRLGMMNDAVAIRRLLLNPDKTIPMRPGSDPNRQSAHFQGGVIGGAIGLFASFFIGGIITISLMFNRKPDVGSFPFEMLVFPLSLVIGSALGVFIGSRLMPFKKPLLQKPKDPKLEKRVGCAILFGLFAGFMGGAGAGAVLGEALGLRIEQHTPRIALFFGGAGIGAFTGPVVCGILAKKILTARKRDES